MSTQTRDKAPKLPKEKDRRRSARKPHVIQAWVESPTAFARNEKVEVTAVNVSRHGVAFHSRKPFPVEAFFIIEIGIGDQSIRSEIRAISCRPCADGSFEVGGEFF